MPNKGKRATGSSDVTARGTTSVIHQTAIRRATQRVRVTFGFPGTRSTNSRIPIMISGTIRKLIICLIFINFAFRRNSQNNNKILLLLNDISCSKIRNISGSRFPFLRIFSSRNPFFYFFCVHCSSDIHSGDCAWSRMIINKMSLKKVMKSLFVYQKKKLI